MTAAIAAIYSVFSVELFAHFGQASYDMVIFDQAVRSYAHFHPGISIVKGIHDGFGPNFSVLGDHISPIISALAPLYWIYSGPQTLLVAQSVLFALAIPFIWRFTYRAFGGGQKAIICAYLVSVVYGLSWPLASAAAYDFHEVAFAPVLTAIALERFQAGRLKTALVALAFLLLVKEDMGLLVAGIGIALAASGSPTVRKQKIVGICLVVAGVAYSAFATYVLIPAFGGQSNYYWAYQALGSNVPQVIAHIIRHPISTLRMLLTPQVKLHTIGWLLLPFCLLPLLSPAVLAVIPLLLERMLNSKNSNWWTIGWQYNAYLVVPIICAAVNGAVRLDHWVATGTRPFLWTFLFPPRRSEAGGFLLRRSEASGFFARRRQLARLAGVGPIGAAGLEADPADTDDALTAEEAVPETSAEPAADHTADSDGPAARVGRARTWADTARVRRVREALTSGARPKPGVMAITCFVVMLVVTLGTLPHFKLGMALHPTFWESTERQRAAIAADAAVPDGVVVEAYRWSNLGPAISSRDTVLLWDRDVPPRRTAWVLADVKANETAAGRQHAQVSLRLILQAGYQVVFRQDGFFVLHLAGVSPSAVPDQEIFTPSQEVFN